MKFPDFYSPWLFLLLIPAVAAAWIFLKKKQPSVIFPDLSAVTNGKKRFLSYKMLIPFVLICISLVLIILALTRPREGLEEIKQRSNGVDIITLGDHAWDQKDLAGWIDREPRVLRPFNLQTGTPGRGSALVDTPSDKVGVLCLCGRTFMAPGPENPFTAARAEVARLRAAGACAVLVDIHGEATSEKIAMALHTDGKATAVVGTHTHVQTADARILPGGTAAITDVGMCGSRDGVIGRDAADVLHANLTSLPCKLNIGGWPARVSGVVITADETTGRAISIHPINRDYDR